MDSSQVPEGYKQTEVGVIPDEWKVLPLEVITQPDRPISYGIVQTGPRVPNGVPCLRVVDIIEGQIKKGSLITTSEKISSSYKRTQLRTGDLVMPLRGKIGEVAIVDSELVNANLTRGVALIALQSGYVEGYIKQAIRCDSSSNRLENMLNGSALKEISIATLRSFKIAIPPENEQQEISDALNGIDTLITSLEKLIAKKRAIKTATMQQLLTGKKRLPEFERHPNGELKGYKQTELGEIPEDWNISNLGTLAGITRGASPRPIDSPIWFDGNSDIGWVRISDVTKSSKYLTQTVQKLSQAGVRQSRFVEKHSLIMSICATVGRPILTKVDVCIHDGFVVFSNPTVNKDFLYYFFTFIEQDWSKHGQTGSQMNLNTGLINSTLMRVPSNMDEQASIANCIADIDTELLTIQTRLNKTQQLKQGMMQELLTGRTRLV